jgi:hypothetical protein
MQRLQRSRLILPAAIAFIGITISTVNIDAKTWRILPAGDSITSFDFLELAECMQEFYGGTMSASALFRIVLAC